MRTHVLSAVLAAALLTLFPASLARAQGPADTGSGTPAPTLLAQPPTGEREIRLEREHPLEILGLPKPELAGARFSGFFLGSFNYNSRVQLMPEFAGNAPAPNVEPGRTNFSFDKFGLGVSWALAPWLSVSGAIEVERHPEFHSHGFDPDFGCPGTGVCVEQRGAEETQTEISLDLFEIRGIVPIGNGLALSFGRFNVPFGIERHDENLILTATQSEVFDFGRPDRMTGLQASYQFTPWLDLTTWIVNRWENETTEASPDDNNADKSFGGRIGFTPFPRQRLLNIGLGGFWGPEQDDQDSEKRWVVDLDFTWSPTPRLLIAGEVIYGGESGVSFRERGIPFPAPAVTNKDVNWWGFYLLAHYDILDWLGFSFRYGYFDDQDAARTGVEQVLQSWTFTPIVHLSRLIPDLRPPGVTYARTRHPLDWVDLKLEYRLNHSNEPVFSDARPGVPILDAEKTSHQVIVQFVVNF